MNWVVFVTVWIILQTIVRACRVPRLCRLEGKPENYVVARIAGTIVWGILMIGSLYMAGLYNA